MSNLRASRERRLAERVGFVPGEPAPVNNLIVYSNAVPTSRVASQLELLAYLWSRLQMKAMFDSEGDAPGAPADNADTAPVTRYAVASRHPPERKPHQSKEANAAEQRADEAGLQAEEALRAAEFEREAFRNRCR
jgi:hypothetical protein